MSRPCLTAAVCLCVFAMARAAAVPTQPSEKEAIVVARSDEAPAAEKSPVSVTTEEPNAPIDLTEMEVLSEVTMRYARTAVLTTVKNPAKRSQEATFRVLLPETAFISGFTMILNGVPYKAYVKEKEEALQIYNEAVSLGVGAAHVAAKARDSNHFTVSVNVEPYTTAVFNLTYEEMLVRRNGVYNHDINLHPGSLVPKLTVKVNIKEAQKITTLRVPEVRTGNEIDATSKDPQNSHVTIELGNDEHDATIIFKPDLEEQRRLIEIYVKKTKASQQSQSRPNQFYQQKYDSKNDIEGVLGQFVVQYDVERPPNGEILVNDGYFVHFYAPADLPPLNKHVVFVLDTSGSMLDRKIEQLRQAMHSILAELRAGDYFNIVEFSSSTIVHDLNNTGNTKNAKNSDAYWAIKPATLLPPSPATKEYIARAKTIVDGLVASGGTNIADALSVGVDLIQRGVNPNPAPTNTKDEKQTVQAGTSVSEVQTVGEPKSKNLEPIIIFLTDGDPTVGETNPKVIINRISEKNSGPRRASLFSLAFGEDADPKFLRKLSLRNEGFMRRIYEAADAALQLQDFYRQVSSPLLADVKFVYPIDQIKDGSLTKHTFRTIYDGSEAVVAGRIAADATAVEPTLFGYCGVDDGFIKKFEIRTKGQVTKKKNYLPLERLWAYLTVKQLLDERDADVQVDPKDENGPVKKALKLALKYEFVTPLTSLVVVKPNATNTVNAESFDKPAAPLNFYNRAPAAAGLAVPQFSKVALKPTVGHVLPLAPSQDTAPAPVPPPIAAEAAIEPVQEEEEEEPEEAEVDPQEDLTDSQGTSEAPPLQTYNLEDYDWTTPLISFATDVLSLTVNQTVVELKLVTDDNIPTSGVDEDATCSPSTDGTNGTCVYLTSCEAAKNITADVYKKTYCSVSGYAGVCCPTTQVNTTTGQP